MKCKTCGCELEAYDVLDYRCWHRCNDYPVLLKIIVFLQIVILLFFLGLSCIILFFVVVGEKVRGVMKCI